MRDADDPRAIVARGYETLGNRYWEWSRDNDPKHRERYVGMALELIAPGSHVVELGSGSGIPTAQIISATHDLACVDVAESQLALVARNAPDARRVCSDMTDVRFLPGSLDMVVAFYSVFHVPREEHGSLFARVAEWLRPGGVFVASLGAHDNPSAIDEWVDDVTMFWSSYDADTNRALLRDTGFELVGDEVLRNFEDGREVEFLWVLAGKR